ncbi:hypothetical protein AB0L53_03380 [Nonomuraea sp. NPDC052129]|uniref:hypothetical protein n=1 Tax=Nonomuraea sp. NPDC052129 TaxID=3154651 RepID=UPI00341BE389
MATRALHGIPRTEVRELDLADPDSIRTFSDRFLETGRALDIVINNAGVMAYPNTLIGAGWEAHFAINHLGHHATSEGRQADGFKTPAQGAATAVWAATSPLLDEYGGAYCQDCDIAEPATTDDMLVGGVKPWAIDPDSASRLWALSGELTGLDCFS